jgi:hypothetical protein
VAHRLDSINYGGCPSNIKKDTGANNKEAKEDGDNAVSRNLWKHLVISSVAKETAVATRIIAKRAPRKGTQELPFGVIMKTAEWKN